MTHAQDQRSPSSGREAVTERRRVTSREPDAVTERRRVTSREPDAVTERRRVTSREPDAVTERRRMTSRGTKNSSARGRMACREPKNIAARRQLLPRLAVAAIGLMVVAARPPTYGGEIVNYVYGRPLCADPADTRTAADSAAHAASFEPLYSKATSGLVPILARERPSIEGRTVIIPLRRGVVLHDGRPLTPERVVEALQRLASRETAAYVVAPIQRANGRLSIVAEPDAFAVRIELRHSAEDYPYLLASDHARLAWTTSDKSLVGSGPFQWRTPREQRPFLGYREGRPFTERLVWRPYASRFGAGALAQRGRVAVFGGPETPRAYDGPGTWLVLQIGSKAGDRETRHRIRTHVQSALRRPRIVRRYLGPKDEPAVGFVAEPIIEPKGTIKTGQKLELLAPKGLRFGHRLVERIQLDLFRSGLRAQIRWVEPSAFDAESARGFDLRLFEIRPGVPLDGSLRAAFHATLSVAAALGALAKIDVDAPMAQFAAATDDAARRQALLTLEHDMRRATGAVVIGRAAPAIALPSDWAPSPLGTVVDWANLIPGDVR